MQESQTNQNITTLIKERFDRLENMNGNLLTKIETQKEEFQSELFSLKEQIAETNRLRDEMTMKRIAKLEEDLECLHSEFEDFQTEHSNQKVDNYSEKITKFEKSLKNFKNENILKIMDEKIKSSEEKVKEVIQTQLGISGQQNLKEELLTEFQKILSPFPLQDKLDTKEEPNNQIEQIPQKNQNNFFLKNLNFFEVNYPQKTLFNDSEKKPTFIAYSNSNDYLAVRRSIGAKLSKDSKIQEFNIGDSKFFHH